MARMQAHRLHGALHGFANAGVGWIQRLAGAGKLQQGIDEVRHLVHAGADFLIQFFALRRSQAAVAKKFRVRDDGGERVT
jgi:hypothetical protein